MSENKISQHTAILLEHARKCGLSTEEILQAIRSGKVEVFAKAQNGHFEYDELFSYANGHREDLEKAVLEGYRITFNTRNGLKIWLEETFGLSSGSDFTVGEGFIEGVTLNAAELARLKQALAVNWTISEELETKDGLVVKLTVRGL